MMRTYCWLFHWVGVDNCLGVNVLYLKKRGKFRELKGRLLLCVVLCRQTLGWYEPIFIITRKLFIWRIGCICKRKHDAALATVWPFPLQDPCGNRAAAFSSLESSDHGRPSHPICLHCFSVVFIATRDPDRGHICAEITELQHVLVMLLQCSQSFGGPRGRLSCRNQWREARVLLLPTVCDNIFW